MLNLKMLLSFGVDDTVYIVDYTIHNRQTCKTCTIDEFLRELVDYTEKEIAHIIKTANFRRF